MAIKKEIKNLGLAWEESYGYAQGVKVGDTIWLSGQVGVNAQGKYGTLEEQFRNAYGYIVKVLGMYGANLSNVVDEVIYRTGDSKDFSTVASKVRKEVYGGIPPVCSTLVHAVSIGGSGCQLEIKVVAKV